MAPAFTITKIRCPACKGSAKSPSGFRCLWCDGIGKAKVVNSLRWVSMMKTLARGGYITGDHSLDDMRQMECEAGAVTAFLQSVGILPMVLA